MGVHLTARIPELAAKTVDLELSNSDLLPVYIAAENKTKKVSLQDFITHMQTGGGTSHGSVEWLGEYIYIVPALAAGTVFAYIPSLEDYSFTLERGGLPMIPLLDDLSNADVAEFSILDTGGFKLEKDGDALVEDERFKLVIKELLVDVNNPPTTIASFINGKKVVTADVTLNAITEMNRIIQVRGDTSPIVITLPSIDDIAANSFIPIETAITNTKPCTVQTTGGQYIYINNASKTSIVLHPGEVVWLFRDSDGFYIINDFAERYKQLAKPYAAFKADLNQLVCKGQELLRADYPRLWEYIQTLGSSFVSESTWQTSSETVAGRTVNNPYRGCFSSGDGSTTFRMPDLMNMFLRSVKTESGSDTERHLNKPGGYQKEEVLAHTHVSNPDGLWNESGNGHVASGGNSNEGATAHVTGSYGGAETRPDNVGVLWVINV